MDVEATTRGEATDAQVAPQTIEKAAAGAPLIGRYDPVERARQKQAMRDQDAADLASGRKTREQLVRENSWLRGLRVKVDLAGAKRLW